MRPIASNERSLIEEFLDQMRETAQKVFERDGFCTPVVVFLADGQQAVLPLGALGPNKDVAALVLRKLIEKTRPLAFVMVTEAWLAKATDSAVTGNPPADMEKKYRGRLTVDTPDGKERPKEGVREAVMVQCSSVTGESFTLTAEIVRTAGSKPALQPWERMDNSQAQGRFIFDVTPLEMRQ
jgi:hypothetical protein